MIVTMQKYPIDSDWFFQQLRRKNKSVRGLGRFMNIDAGAASRMLNGQRNMSAKEQDQVAQFLEVSIEDVAVHRNSSRGGFAETKQTDFIDTEPSSPKKEAGFSGDKPKRHPVFGCMKGTMTIPDDLDLTAPIDVEWSSKLYNE
ncbi:MAG: helix-turn-helix transcriptional regulator [Shinella sp.]|nr:helix-turn-helix transcriptional regulator [Shinella sp.]